MQHAQLFTMSIFVTFISNNTITEALIFFFYKAWKNNVHDEQVEKQYCMFLCI